MFDSKRRVTKVNSSGTIRQAAATGVRLDIIGDNGSSQLSYEGKTVVLFGADSKQYSTISLMPRPRGQT
jgi:hypothetical protein